MISKTKDIKKNCKYSIEICLIKLVIEIKPKFKKICVIHKYNNIIYECLEV